MAVVSEEEVCACNLLRQCVESRGSLSLSIFMRDDDSSMYGTVVVNGFTRPVNVHYSTIQYNTILRTYCIIIESRL
jgi:hypothetical protein